MSSLSSLFERAGIPLETAPAEELSPEVFQLDIPRHPSERVRLWAGDAGSEVDVLSLDAAFGQIVLRLREPRRPVVARIRGPLERAESLVRDSGGRILRRRGASWLVERVVEPAERRFLLGYDDRHLFAAQLPSGDSVRQAHDVLKPPALRAAEERRAGAFARQGEWFFLPVTPREESEVREHIRTTPYARRRGRLPGAGEPHRAEELVLIPDGRDPRSGEPRDRLFARGSVHHRDHRALWFDRWRAVHLNTAVRARALRPIGLRWFD